MQARSQYGLPRGIVGTPARFEEADWKEVKLKISMSSNLYCDRIVDVQYRPQFTVTGRTKGPSLVIKLHSWTQS
jgi:hypothetical protein